MKGQLSELTSPALTAQQQQRRKRIAVNYSEMRAVMKERRPAQWTVVNVARHPSNCAPLEKRLATNYPISGARLGTFAAHQLPGRARI